MILSVKLEKRTMRQYYLQKRIPHTKAHIHLSLNRSQSMFQGRERNHLVISDYSMCNTIDDEIQQSVQQKPQSVF